jgi:galactose mutarotase-like enzyme
MLLTPGSGRIEVSRLALAKRYHRIARHRQVSRLHGVARAGIFERQRKSGSRRPFSIQIPQTCLTIKNAAEEYPRVD